MANTSFPQAIQWRTFYFPTNLYGEPLLEGAQTSHAFPSHSRFALLLLTMTLEEWRANDPCYPNHLRQTTVERDMWKDILIRVKELVPAISCRSRGLISSFF